MRFEETSREQALAYKVFVEGQHEVRLRDLAWLMRDSPEFDLIDASSDSAVPMWEWWQRFALAGFPGVPDDARPGYAIFLGWPRRADDRSAAAGEMLDHYLLEKYKGVYPRATFETYESNPRHGIENRHHRVGLRLNEKVFVHHTQHGAHMLSTFLSGGHQNTDALFRSVYKTRHSGTPPAGPSMLARFLNQPPLPWDDPSRVPPRASDAGPAIPDGTPDSVPRGTALGESELIFAAIGTDVQDFDNAIPLDEPAIAAALAELGFEARSLEDALHVSQTQLQHPSSAILVEVFAHRGRLRALHFELHGSEEDNLAVVAAFTDLGHRLHARLGSEDDWSNSNQA